MPRSSERTYAGSRVIRVSPRALLLILLTAELWLTHAPREVAQADNLPAANTVVEARAYISLEPVPRGRTFEVAVVAKIRPGFHINAHKPSEDYLIPTTLEAELPPGLRALETIYPPGALRKLQFSPTQLSVYEGSVTLRMKLRAASEAPLGARKLPLTLRYQACSDQACLPPVKRPITAELVIAPAGTSARSANSAVFSAPMQPKASSPR